MHSFTDTRGCKWDLEITVAAVKRLRARAGVDLLKLAEDRFRPLAELVADVVRLADVLFVLVEEQATAAGVSDEDFGRALGGDVLAQAADAFVEELIDFFPHRKARETLRQVVQKSRTVRDRILEQAAQELATVDPVALADELLAHAKASTGSSTGSPGSPASTPTR